MSGVDLHYLHADKGTRPMDIVAPRGNDPERHGHMVETMTMLSA